MSTRPTTPRGWLLAATAAAATAIVLLPAGAAFAAPAPNGATAAFGTAASAPAAASASLPADVEAATAALAATPWVTTGAVDQNGDAVALEDPRAANFVGNAYFRADGTFDMFTLGTDAPKMHGNWDMRVVDGRLSRWIQALNADGSVAFERTVEIVRLDAGVFTYRVPGENGTHTDIVHEPTDYSVTAAATAELAATPWVTTGAVDQNGDAVALDDPRAANFVGNAYFRADGTFSMYQLDDAPKMHGNWDMRVVDGRLSRWIQALNADDSVAFERTVEIVRLDAGVFTYRVPGE
ncbi:DUF4822 domain-containing protein, partial [Leucobacter zeae]|nr:DUF4822 domain-containing protein [Leucobacter zeae]